MVEIEVDLPLYIIDFLEKRAKEEKITVNELVVKIISNYIGKNL